MKIDFRADFDDQVSGYETASLYLRGHAGLGYVWAINEAADIDLYDNYLWLFQGGEELWMTTGGPLDFDPLTSQ